MAFQTQHGIDIKEWIKRHDLNLQEEDILYLIYDAIDNSIGAIIITDLKGIITYVNKSFLDIFGTDRDTVIRKQISSIFVIPESDDFACLTDKIDQNSLCQMKRYDNSLFYALTITSHVENLQGEYSGQIFSFIDMTVQKELEDSQQVLIQQLEQSQRKLVSLNETLEQISLEDKLTGLANRRSFDIGFDLEWRRARRDKIPLSLLMIDVDNFKLYNDRYGHQMGDHCLRGIADAMKESGIANRAGDIVARYGGEEFVVVLTHTGNADAFVLAEKIVAKVSEKGIAHVDNRTKVATISVGVATIQEYENHTKEDLVEEADQALYRAKSSGKSCVR